MIAKPMDGYIRVSRRLGREGPGYISPSVQRDAIQRWADYKGVEIAEWHIDEDESGGTQDRPGLNAATQRAISGATAGVVSWKIDRFSRYTEGGLRDLRELEAVDARLAFVIEDIDTSGPMGRFVYTVMLAMGEYFLGTIKAGWVTAKTRAVERGAHIGPTPYGYERNPDGTLQAHRERGPVVTEAFTIAAGSGPHAAMDFLLERAPERTWTLFTTERFLRNDAYLGRVSYGELRNDTAHEALTDRATFEAATHGLSARGRRRPSGDYPLTGLVVCGTCGGGMVGGRGGADNRRVYRCAARCDAPPVVTADLLEAHVVGLVRDRYRNAQVTVGEHDAGSTEAVALVEEAERALDAFAADTKARQVLGHRYHRALEAHARAVEEAEEALRATVARAGQSRQIVPDEAWDSLEPAELAEVLRGGIESIVVDRGRRPLPDRVRVRVLDGDGGTVLAGEDAGKRGIEP